MHFFTHMQLECWCCVHSYRVFEYTHTSEMVFLECSHKEIIILFVFVPPVYKRTHCLVYAHACSVELYWLCLQGQIEQIERRCVLWHGEGGHGI